MEPETTETKKKEKKKEKKKKKKKEDEESIIIPTPCRLKELHLGHNMISDASNQALDVVMDSLPQLTHLDLSWNRLKAETAAILAQRISDTRCSLKVLNLQFNRVGNMGVSLLLQPLCRTPAPSLELLDLSFNGVVLEGDVLVDVIEVVSRSKKLKSLQMNGNELLDEVFQTIQNVVVETTKRRGGGGGSGTESSTSLVVGLESSAVAIVSMDH
jgi:Ran GTPase-activating protein (RanGAP) involved in mRNA processing and transport